MPDLPFVNTGVISEEFQVVCKMRLLFPKAMPALPQYVLFDHLSVILIFQFLFICLECLLSFLVPVSPLEPFCWHHISHLPILTVRYNS